MNTLKQVIWERERSRAEAFISYKRWKPWKKLCGAPSGRERPHYIHLTGSSCVMEKRHR